MNFSLPYFKYQITYVLFDNRSKDDAERAVLEIDNAFYKYLK